MCYYTLKNIFLLYLKNNNNNNPVLPLFLSHSQVQATVIGFLAAVAAVVLGWIPEGKFQFSHAVLLCSSSVATAFIASMLQGTCCRLTTNTLICSSSFHNK